MATTETNIALLKRDMTYVRDAVEKMEVHMEKQNGKVSKNTAKINWVMGIGSAVAIAIPIVITFLV